MVKSIDEMGKVSFSIDVDDGIKTSTIAATNMKTLMSQNVAAINDACLKARISVPIPINIRRPIFRIPDRIE